MCGGGFQPFKGVCGPWSGIEYQISLKKENSKLTKKNSIMIIQHEVFFVSGGDFCW